jgi:hypothetical protein
LTETCGLDNEVDFPDSCRGQRDALVTVLAVASSPALLRADLEPGVVELQHLGVELAALLLTERRLDMQADEIGIAHLGGLVEFASANLHVLVEQLAELGLVLRLPVCVDLGEEASAHLLCFGVGMRGARQVDAVACNRVLPDVDPDEERIAARSDAAALPSLLLCHSGLLQRRLGSPCMSPGESNQWV